MALPIFVDVHSGGLADECPLRFPLDMNLYEIASVEDRSDEPRAEYFQSRWATKNRNRCGPYRIELTATKGCTGPASRV